ncbi:hypothetical protein RB195_003733 [Necator americanus]|uniref:7TM GPCR serpentine receptor class x (Srx) domain-containing protein n=1 Tax=Necator americanus TaxID=51031 RepID=A0ABR1DQ52_NECAM
MDIAICASLLYDGILNYANLFMDTPIDIISSVTCITCYTYILAFMRRMRGDCRNRTNRHGLREYRYALQFFAICIFYLAAWLCRRTLPLIVGAGRVEYFIAVPICVALNCSANSLVYITTNPEVRRNLSIRRATLIGLTTQSVGNIRTAPANPKTQA